MKTRKTPRERVVEHLAALGFEFMPGSTLQPHDIVFTHGGKHKSLSEILECWHVDPCVDKDGKRTSIYSAHTLTECARGIGIEQNTIDSDLYGELIAIPTKKGTI